MIRTNRLISNMEIKNNELYIGGINTNRLAKEFGTPLYVYDFDRVAVNIKRLKEAFDCVGANVKIYYAIKSNSSLALLKFLRNKVDGIDAASYHEVKSALKVGFNSDRITVTTPALNKDDLGYLLKKKVLINTDSFSQIDQIAEIANSCKIGIRINPLIEIGGPSPLMRTAGDYSKCGILFSKAVQAVERAKNGGLEEIVGLHCHAGSNWLAKDLSVFEKIAEVMTKTAKEIGNFTKLEYLDFGGGIGIPHKNNEKEFSPDQLIKYTLIIKKALDETGVREARIEPGRFLVGDAGVLLTKIIHVDKYEKPVRVAITDAGCGTFARPYIYGAYHQILACSKMDNCLAKKYIIGGNTGAADVFNANTKELRQMPPLEEEDILAILNTGAYGFAMSSQFVSHPRPAEVAITNKRYRLIRKKENYSDLIRNQIF